MVIVAAADATESAVQKIARRAEGEEISPRDLFDLIMAVDEDANARHADEVRMAKAVATAHERRLHALEGWQQNWEASCPGRLEGALDGLRQELNSGHIAFHEAHMAEYHVPHRADDPPNSDFTDRRGAGVPAGEDEARKVWVLWGVGQRLLMIATAVIASGLTMLLSWLIFGNP